MLRSPLLLLLALGLSVAAGTAGTAWRRSGGSAAAGPARAALHAAPSERARPAAADAGAKYLLYEITLHEQLNKQRKGFMFAVGLAQRLGRELVLAPLRARAAGGGDSRRPLR